MHRIINAWPGFPGLPGFDFPISGLHAAMSDMHGISSGYSKTVSNLRGASNEKGGGPGRGFAGPEGDF